MRRTAIVVAMGAIMTLAGMRAAVAAAASQISARYNADAQMFHGKVSSANAECQAGRTVKLFKQTANGRMLEGMATSNAQGGWKAEVMNAGGMYFAVTPREKVMNITCDRARSNTIDVM
jgi:hypothetical protein